MVHTVLNTTNLLSHLSLQQPSGERSIKPAFYSQGKCPTSLSNSVAAAAPPCLEAFGDYSCGQSKGPALTAPGASASTLSLLLQKVLLHFWKLAPRPRPYMACSHRLPAAWLSCRRHPSRFSSCPFVVDLVCEPCARSSHALEQKARILFKCLPELWPALRGRLTVR